MILQMVEVMFALELGSIPRYEAPQRGWLIGIRTRSHLGAVCRLRLAF